MRHPFPFGCEVRQMHHPMVLHRVHAPRFVIIPIAISISIIAKITHGGLPLVVAGWKGQGM